MSGASPSLPPCTSTKCSATNIPAHLKQHRRRTDGRLKGVFFSVFWTEHGNQAFSNLWPQHRRVRERVRIASYVISELLIGYCRGMRVGPAKGSVGPYCVRFLFAIVLDCSDINGPLYYLHPNSRRALNGESYFTRFFSLPPLSPTKPFSFPLTVFIIIPQSSIGIPVACRTKDPPPRIFRS